MMAMLGVWRLGRWKTKFRNCEGRDEKGGGRREEKQGLKKKLGRCVTILFVTDLDGWDVRGRVKEVRETLVWCVKQGFEVSGGPADFSG